MGRRRKARETALQFLYQLDVGGSDDPTSQAPEFWSRYPVDLEARTFAEELVVGTKQNQGKIDGLIAQSAEHWDLDRMAAVDRNILRAAVYELLWHPEVPPKVTINEAIEIAKKFGNDDSGPFVNGILDAVRAKLELGTIDLPEGLAEHRRAERSQAP